VSDTTKVLLRISLLGARHDPLWRRWLSWILRKIFFRRTRFGPQFVAGDTITVDGEEKTIVRVVNATTLEIGGGN